MRAIILVYHTQLLQQLYSPSQIENRDYTGSGAYSYGVVVDGEPMTATLYRQPTEAYFPSSCVTPHQPTCFLVPLHNI
jgi:hypothetical protein